MATIELVRGNTAPDLTCRLSNSEGWQDLTGATITARLTNLDTGVVTVLDCGAIVPFTDGWVLIPAPNDGWPLGYHTLEYDVVFANLKEQTWPSKGEDLDYVLVRDTSEAP
jgi:hypothetical protein